MPTKVVMPANSKTKKQAKLQLTFLKISSISSVVYYAATVLTAAIMIMIAILSISMVIRPLLICILIFLIMLFSVCTLSLFR